MKLSWQVLIDLIGWYRLCEWRNSYTFLPSPLACRNFCIDVNTRSPKDCSCWDSSLNKLPRLPTYSELARVSWLGACPFLVRGAVIFLGSP